MASTKPGTKRTPTRGATLAVFSVAVGVAAALIASALLLHKHKAPAPQTSPGVSLVGIPQSGRQLGHPDARVTLIEFADPQCPACRYYTLNVYPRLVKQYVRTGKVKMRFHGFPFIGADSVTGLRFIFAAGLQDRLWQLEEALYRYQGTENSGWLTNDLVRQLARKIPGLDVGKLVKDAKSPEVTSMITRDLRDVRNSGINSTPTVFIQIGGQKPYALQNPLDLALMRAALADALKG